MKTVATKTENTEEDMISEAQSPVVKKRSSLTTKSAYSRRLRTSLCSTSSNQQNPKAEFDQLIATEKNLIVVDFFATWCGPCKAIAPHLAKWAEEYDDVTFIKIDVDENEDTAEACGISAMPTFHFYKNGKKVDEIVGANHEKIKEKILALK